MDTAGQAGLGQLRSCPERCLGFPGSSVGQEPACQGRRRWRFNLWVRKIPWRRKWQPTLVVLSGRSRGQRSLVSYSPQGCKESDMTEHEAHT